VIIHENTEMLSILHIVLNFKSITLIVSIRSSERKFRYVSNMPSADDGQITKIKLL